MIFVDFHMISTDIWSSVTTTGAAFTARKKHSSVLCQSSGVIYTFGGTSASIFGDMWRFNISSSAWALVTPTGTSMPGPRKGHSAVLDATGTLMYVVAGQTASTGTLRDTWRFNITSSTF